MYLCEVDLKQTMKNLHILPTDKPSRIFYLAGNLHLEMGQLITPKDYQNIYITSDEKFIIDEYVTDGISVMKASPKSVDAQGFIGRRDWRKIILTTDQDLIKDGVQSIDDEFLEWFVKNPTCEEIEIKHEYSSSKCLKCSFIENHDKVDTKNCPKCSNTTYEHFYEDKIVIPQEKPCTQDIVDEAMKIVSKDVRQPKCVRDGLVQKQETLEETAERLFPKEKHPTSFETLRRAFISNAVRQQRRQETLEEAAVKYATNHGMMAYVFPEKRESFIDGAKWQSERMYSEEEVRLMLSESFKASQEGYDITSDSIIEQFKKK
jgi:hypothetical protein